jgi:hypothetical protein
MSLGQGKEEEEVTMILGQGSLRETFDQGKLRELLMLL